MTDEPRPDLAALYLRHRDTMYRVAASVLREVGRAGEAEDAVNDAVVSIMTSPPQDVRNWEAFLVTAVKRKALDRVRSAEVRHAEPVFVEPAQDRADDIHLAEDVVESVDRCRRASRAWESLSVLDERHRRAVWETMALERPRADVAADLGVTPARVSQMVTRGLGLLRDELARREGGDHG